MKKINLIIFSSFIFFACINTNLNSKNDIANTQKKTNDTIFVKEYSAFNKNDIGKEIIVDNYSKIRIQKISKTEIKDLCSKKKVTCLVFWAPWCTGCCKALKSIYKEIINENKSNATFALISISDNLNANQKELYNSQYFLQSYVLDSDFYKGTSEDDFPKLRLFLDEIFPNKQIKHYVPLMIMVNQKQELLANDPMYKDEIKRIINGK